MAQSKLSDDTSGVGSGEPEPHGRVGGIARAAALTPEERSEIARKAVQARWRMAKARAAATPPPKPVRKKNPHAVALGKLGGSKGGRTAAENMTAEERKERAKKAAEARWAKTEKQAS